VIEPFSRITLAILVFVALQHFAFFALESFLWKKPLGRQVFGLTPERAELTAPLAFNQGFYNAFLGAGLVWSIVLGLSAGLGYAEFARSLAKFFLGCVAVAGIVGGASVNRRIFLVQALPAILGLASLLLLG
jgi:putative membrane protein